MHVLVDTHCHIDLDDFDEDRAAMLERAGDVGVVAVVVIGYSPERWVSTGTLVAENPTIVRSVGLHPNEASRWDNELLERLTAELNKDDAVAIGEIGLDFYRDRAPEGLQRDAFREQLEVARQRDLPVIIHQRAAEQEVLEMLELGPRKGVMHCFSGDHEFARACLDRDFYLGVGGVITYPRSEEIRDAIRRVPLDRLVLETDAPYLAPQGKRGKRNEPAYLPSVLELVSALHSRHLEEVAEITTRNAIDLFGPTLEKAVTSAMVVQG